MQLVTQTVNMKTFGLWKTVGITVALLLGAALALPAQTLKVLDDTNDPVADGLTNVSLAPLLEGADGYFYGTTYADGTNNSGTVFRMTPSGAVAVLYNFCSEANCADGAFPEAGLVQGRDRDFYGTASGKCGSTCDGTVFKISRTGKLTTLYSFCSLKNCADGASPMAGLVLGADGNFYGTTYSGGMACNIFFSCGTVFRITPSGKLTTLYVFCPTGSNCHGHPWGLVQGTNGNFYGTTWDGGVNQSTEMVGSVFKITPAGTLTTLYSFCSRSHCADGSLPMAGVIQGRDGNFYGTTTEGGASIGAGAGTIFRVGPSGTLKTLYVFCASGTNPDDCPDGSIPAADLVQGSDGNFYGTTAGGGYEYLQSNCAEGLLGGCGTIFRMTPGGKLTTLYDFCTLADCDDGAAPAAALIQSTDGGFYGTTSGYAENSAAIGTIFRLSTGLEPK
jgi:uncharacterized repeat protein (TIGR03803 family)